jgi:hypothetical protein
MKSTTRRTAVVATAATLGVVGWGAVGPALAGPDSQPGPAVTVQSSRAQPPTTR